MLKITRAAKGEMVIELISAGSNGRRIVLDLKDVKLVDQDAVSFLKRYEAESIQLKNFPVYIREWITGERR
jgi:hypothetical protein